MYDWVSSIFSFHFFFQFCSLKEVVERIYCILLFFYNSDYHFLRHSLLLVLFLYQWPLPIRASLPFLILLRPRRVETDRLLSAAARIFECHMARIRMLRISPPLCTCHSKSSMPFIHTLMGFDIKCLNDTGYLHANCLLKSRELESPERAVLESWMIRLWLIMGLKWEAIGESRAVKFSLLWAWKSNLLAFWWPEALRI